MQQVREQAGLGLQREGGQSTENQPGHKQTEHHTNAGERKHVCTVGRSEPGVRGRRHTLTEPSHGSLV